MTTARRQYLRDVMALAWGLYRSDPSRGFADCLSGAWRWTKGREARRSSRPAWATAGRPVTVSLCSMVQSPIRRSLPSGHRESTARALGYVTSVMGR